MQGNLFVVEHGIVISSEVLRDVEVGREAPDRAAHAFRAGTTVVEFHSPEVVGVVPQVAHSVAVGHSGAKASVFRIDDSLYMTGFRVIGGTEDQTPTSGIVWDVPTQGHATRLNAVFIVGRSRVESEAFNSRARHRFSIDRNLEIGSR